MKKDYIKPIIEIEEFELNAAIAAGCTNIVTLGPGDPEHQDVCDEYEGLLRNRSYSNPFYETSCTCYLSAPGESLATS